MKYKLDYMKKQILFINKNTILILLFFLFFTNNFIFSQEKSADKVEDKKTFKEKRILANFISLYNNNQGLGFLYKPEGRLAYTYQFFLNSSDYSKTVIDSGPCIVTLCGKDKTTYGVKSILSIELLGHSNTFASFQIGFLPGYTIKYTEYLKMPYYNQILGITADNNYYSYTFNRNPSMMIGFGGGKKIFFEEGFYYSFEIGGRLHLSSNTSTYGAPNLFNILLNNPPPNLISAYLATKRADQKVANYEIYFGVQLGFF